MKKILILLLSFFLVNPSYAWFWDKKKDSCDLFVMPMDPRDEIMSERKLENYDVFQKNSRIYFLIYNPKGFKSDYIKYQLVKQDDKAHIGGYSRVRNKTKRVQDKNYYIDYFVLSETGKYILQIFDIENLHHWLAITRFLVIDD